MSHKFLFDSFGPSDFCGSQLTFFNQTLTNQGFNKNFFVPTSSLERFCSTRSDHPIFAAPKLTFFDQTLTNQGFNKNFFVPTSSLESFCLTRLDHWNFSASNSLFRPNLVQARLQQSLSELSRSIQLSYSATSRCGTVLEEDSVLLRFVQTFFQGHVVANLLEGRRSFEYVQMTKKIDAVCRQVGHRSHGLSLSRRTLYPTELLGDVEVWRHV